MKFSIGDRVIVVWQHDRYEGLTGTVIDRGFYMRQEESYTVTLDSTGSSICFLAIELEPFNPTFQPGDRVIVVHGRKDNYTDDLTDCVGFVVSHPDCPPGAPDVYVRLSNGEFYYFYKEQIRHYPVGSPRPVRVEDAIEYEEEEV